MLGIDAFAGDSIPMHLITREAMARTSSHLAPEGVIVFQATNRYIDLMPIVKRLASEVGMQAVLVSDVPFRTGPDYWLSPTDQFSSLVTRRCCRQTVCVMSPHRSRIAPICPPSPTRITISSEC